MNKRVMQRSVQVVCLVLVGVAVGSGFLQHGLSQPPVRETQEPPPVGQQQPTIDQLIDRITELRKQREELERQEKATIKDLQERLRELQQKVAGLGIGERQEWGGPNSPRPVPPAAFPIIPGGGR